MRYGGRFSTHSRPKAAGFVSPALAHALARFQHTAARRRLVLLRCVYSTKILVSTHSLPKAAGNNSFCSFIAIVFQHTAARRRLDGVGVVDLDDHAFQHTAARRRLALKLFLRIAFFFVSTHSRPKAAGAHTYAELPHGHVSTHSRPKAAGMADGMGNLIGWVSTHSRPKAAGFGLPTGLMKLDVSTHSRPKAAGKTLLFGVLTLVCFNTQPPEGGWTAKCSAKRSRTKFQHTAARRRLESFQNLYLINFSVSTHSRPKAAGYRECATPKLTRVSTHSRPKAAGPPHGKSSFSCACFNTQPPEGGWNL